MKNVSEPLEQLTLFESTPDTCCGKMSPEYFPPTTARTSASSWRKLLELKIVPVQCLDLTPGYGNLLGQSFWEMNSAWLGVSWTLNSGVSPNEEKESSLLQILEEHPHQKYYLSKTACLGILRRSESRGKELPIQLKEALVIQAGLAPALSDKPNCHISCENSTPPISEQQSFTTEKMMCLNDQGGSQMYCTGDITGTLRAQEHGHQPLVMAAQNNTMIKRNSQPMLFENHGIDSRYTGPHKVSPTMSARMGTGGNNVPLVNTPLAYSLDSKESNSMKSSNPHSGCRETVTARTIDTQIPDPSKNQGGIAILQNIFCIAGNIIDRAPENGGNGLGCQPDIAYTLTGADRHAVFSRQRSDLFSQNDVTSTQSTRQYKDATDLVCQPYQKTVGTIGYSDHKGINNQFVSEDKCIVEPRNLIRRLTPLECERLQGFPDGWTKLENASDSARYKALGNSVAIPCVSFVLRGIALFLNKE